MTSFVKPDRAIRTWGDWERAKREKNYTKAEEKLVAHCLDGKNCFVDNGELPIELTTENQVNADLLRYLIIGGCKNCDLHEWGVVVAGAYITGVLDLRLVNAVGVTGMINCHFENPVHAMNARLESMNLSGSQCVGVNLQGATVNGDVSLSGGFSSTAEVSLSGAVLGGHLNCEGGSFDSSTGYTFNAQNSEMSVFIWRGVKDFNGKLSLVGAKASVLADDASSWSLVEQAALDGFTYDTIRGPLDEKSRLQWLLKARAYDESFSPQPYEQLAVVLKRMGRGAQPLVIYIEKEKLLKRQEISRFSWRKMYIEVLRKCYRRKKDTSDFTVLTGLRANVDPFNEAYLHSLDRRFARPDSVSLKNAKAHAAHSVDFSISQAAFREWLFRENQKLRAKVFWLLFKDFFLRHFFSYGYVRPGDALRILIALIILGSGVAHMAYKTGDFAPNSAVILSTEEWQSLAEGESKNPAEDWSDANGKGRDYETFNAFAYAVDVVIPLISIGQEEAWAPSTNRGPWGKMLWWLRWVLSISGWVVTGVAAIVFTHMIRLD